jgi:hypothetical protein
MFLRDLVDLWGLCALLHLCLEGQLALFYQLDQLALSLQLHLYWLHRLECLEIQWGLFYQLPQ